MALQIAEKEAARIVYKQYELRGETGLNNFARVVLGCHAEQARRLVNIAKRINGEDELDELFEEVPETITEVIGDSLNVTALTDEPIDAYSIAKQFDIDLDVWKPQYQTIGISEQAKGTRYRIFGKYKYDPSADVIKNDSEILYKDFVRAIHPSHVKIGKWEDSDNLLELFITDPHFDRLANRYSFEEAKRRLINSVNGALNRAYVDGFEKVLLVLNGDIFNSDHLAKTTRGTPQQDSVEARTSFRLIREVIVEAIELCVPYAPTHVIIKSGNHDYYKASYLLDAVWAYFRGVDGVTVDHEIEDRTYFPWGKVLLGFSHGDDSADNLERWMSREVDGFNRYAIREWHVGHLHTRATREREIAGVLIRSFRSQAEPSEWEERNFVTNVAENVAILWNKELGKVAEYSFQFFGD